LHKNPLKSPEKELFGGATENKKGVGKMKKKLKFHSPRRILDV
jgi:hypothetical protein